MSQKDGASNNNNNNNNDNSNEGDSSNNIDGTVKNSESQVQLANQCLHQLMKKVILETWRW